MAAVVRYCFLVFWLSLSVCPSPKSQAAARLVPPGARQGHGEHFRYHLVCPRIAQKFSIKDDLDASPTPFGISEECTSRNKQTSCQKRESINLNYLALKLTCFICRPWNLGTLLWFSSTKADLPFLSASSVLLMIHQYFPQSQILAAFFLRENHGQQQHDPNPEWSVQMGCWTQAQPQISFLASKRDEERWKESQRFFNAYLFYLWLSEQVSEGWHQAVDSLRGVTAIFIF